MKAILSLSGGMDSVTVLALAIEQRREVSCIGFTYGSKHNPFENAAAEAVSKHYKVPFRLIDLTSVMGSFKSNLMAGQGKVPEGHYEAASMSQTVVPGRNIIFSAILAGVAWSEEAEEVWLGIHAGDRAIYPDCRPEFFDAMKNAIFLGTEKIQLRAPVLFDNKISIIKQGLRLGVPYHLTRTCYQAQKISCGRCGACQERLEAFKNNGIEDPIEYESRITSPKE